MSTYAVSAKYSDSFFSSVECRYKNIPGVISEPRETLEPSSHDNLQPRKDQSLTEASMECSQPCSLRQLDGVRLRVLGAREAIC